MLGVALLAVPVRTPPGQMPGAAHSKAVISGPVGPSPYQVVRAWQRPFAQSGFAFGGNSGVFADSPERIIVVQRGETKLPDPLPPGFAGFPGSIGINVLSPATASLRVWRNCFYTLDGDGRVKERWNQWDEETCGTSEGPGPHRIRISPYDPERRLWVINETTDQILVFSNDGKRLLKTLGERNVSASDSTHLGKPQDVAFLPDGRILVADGLDNNRVIILDRNANYVSEFGGKGTGPGQFNGVHALAVGPGARIFVLDRSNGRVNVFRTTPDPAKVEFVGEWDGFQLPLDIIVNKDCVWVTDLGPLRFTKLDFNGKHLYTWTVPSEMPDGFMEVHSFTVDSKMNLYAGDNQYGRTQKLIPKPEADPEMLIAPPWNEK